MRPSVLVGSPAAIFHPVSSVSEIVLCSVRLVAPTSTDNSVSDEPRGWFSEVCERLGIKDAGQVLHHYTERRFHERTLYRYAAGDTAVPGFFCRALLRSNYGEAFLDEFMRGSTAPWWIELQAARTKAALLDKLMAELKEHGIGSA